jgi:hypothetical protein
VGKGLNTYIAYRVDRGIEMTSTAKPEWKPVPTPGMKEVRLHPRWEDMDKGVMKCQNHV